MTLARHKIRQGAFQALFAIQSNLDANPTEVCRQISKEEFGEESIPEYMWTLVQGVSQHQVELDPLIAKHLNTNWSLDRLNKTDLLILRVAVYEMKFQDQVPNKVALDEALELAKVFSDDQSRRFINGVLSNFL